MTAPRPTPDRTETLPRTESNPEPAKRLQLSPVQVAASALAAVSAAVVASFFGVAGTMIGTGLASVISTVSAALYNASLSTSKERLSRLRTRPSTAVGPAAPPAAAEEPPATQLLPQGVSHAQPAPTQA